MVGTVLNLSATQVPDEYSADFLREIVAHLEDLQRGVYFKARHVEIYAPGDSGGREPFLILHSPDGTRWKITVDNAGTIAATDIGDLGL